ncbi:MAG: hypothetical protein MZV64_22650 [Ignavibacteriales bacterium]|nr:hypothetical protein [Ignavibacteriales bacterium]
MTRGLMVSRLIRSSSNFPNSQRAWLVEAADEAACRARPGRRRRARPGARSRPERRRPGG